MANATTPLPCPAGARPAATLPARTRPQLVTAAPAPPWNTEAWSYELKYDGYRLMARVAGREIRLITRTGNDWTGELEPTRRSIATRLLLPDGWYDGELVVLDSRGVPDFALLQARARRRVAEDLTLFLFDCPYLGGYDLRAVPLATRRQVLQAVLPNAAATAIQFSAELTGDPVEILARACDLGLDRIVARRRAEGDR